MKIVFWLLSLIFFWELSFSQKKEIVLSFSGNSTFIYSGGGDTQGFSFTTGASKLFSNIFGGALEYRLAYALTRPRLIHSYDQKAVNYFEAKVSIFPLALCDQLVCAKR